MKVRKLAIALALAGGLGSGLAQALGLGEVDVRSSLNERLDARIEIVRPEGLTPEEVIAGLAPESAFQQAGIDRSFFLNALNFEVVRNNRGNLVVQVTSEKPVREPFLSFLVEVNWPNGRLMREYSLLIDPPTYSAGPAPRVSAPATAETAPSPAAQPRQATRQAAPQPRQASQASGRYGPTDSSDTLWSIAQAVNPGGGVSVQQVMLALQDLNPEAFIDGNINRLKQGYVLRIPTLEQVRSRSARQAIREVVAQNRAFKQRQPSQPPVDATAQSGSTSPAPSRQAEGDELRLVVADQGSETEDGSHGGGAGGTGEGQVDPKLAVALEELDKTRRTNEELSERVDKLEEQLNTLQQLLQLKDSQMAELERQMSEAGIEPKPGQPAGQVPDTAVAEGQPAEEPAEEAEEPAQAEVPAKAAETAGQGGVAGEQAEPAPESPAGPETDAVAGTQETAPEEAAEQPVAAQQPAPEPAPAPAPAEELTTKNFFQQLASNPVYQIGAGGIGLAILGFLWWLARHNAQREKHFYQQLQTETEGPETDDWAEGSSADAEAFGEVGEEAEGAREEGESDAIGEADVYIAYGRLDQAAQVLEEAISSEPSRSDLRLKLLEVYADSGDSAAFEKQLGELKTLDDEPAVAAGEALRERLSEADSTPSIDDLESQLKADVKGHGGTAEAEQPEAGQEAAEEEAAATEGEEETDLGLEWDLDDVSDVNLEEDTGSGAGEAPFAEQDEETSAETDDYSIDYDLSEIESPESDEATTGEVGRQEPEADEEEEAGSDEIEFTLDTDDVEDEEAFDTDDLLSDEEIESLDLETEDLGTDETRDQAAEDTDDFDLDELALDEAESESPADEPAESAGEPAAEQTEESAESLESLDESFLDELDEELDKVTADEDDEALESVEGDELEDLELDVSKEDLALIDEVAGKDADEQEEDLEIPDLEEEAEQPEDTEASGDTGLAEDEPLLDADLEEPEVAVDADTAEQPGEGVTEDEQEALDALAEEPEDLLEQGGAEAGQPDEEEAPEIDDSILEEAESGTAEQESSGGAPDLGGLEDDEDFDFLEGTDEAATKLDLARAYIEMGDSEGARDILEEVAIEGNDEQKDEAQGLLKKLS